MGVALCISLLAVGCGDGDDDSSNGGTGGGPAKPPADLTIGGNLCLSGTSAPNGNHMREGIDLGVKTLNAADEVGGVKLKAVYEDSAVDPQKGLVAAKKLVESDGAKALAMCGSGVLLSSLQVAEGEPDGALLINSGAQSPSLIGASDLLISNIPNGATEAYALMRVLIDRGDKDACLFTASDDFGAGMLKVWQESFPKLGGKVACNETITYGQPDYRSSLSKAKTSKPDALVVYTYGSAIVGFMQQAAELNLDAQVYSFGGVNVPDLVTDKGAPATGLILTTPYFDLQADTPRTKEFMKAYEASGSSEPTPNFYVTGSYEAVLILSDAINHLVDQGKEITGKSLAAAVKEIKTFDGIGGKITINDDGTVTRPLSLQEVEPGKLKVLDKDVDSSKP
jgi:ABC-type branched-subunit amino acid transport system substrate-binding protein